MNKLVILFMLAMFFLPKSYAFTLNNNLSIVFDHNEVKVHIAKGTCTSANIGVSEDELMGIVEQAVDQYWNRAPTSRLKLRAGSIKTYSQDFTNGAMCTTSTSSECTPNTALAVPSDVVIACNTLRDNFSSPNVLAVTLPNNISGTTIVGSLVLLNAIDSTLKNKTWEDKVSIVAHELGHTFGLGHSPVKDSLMYYSTIEFRDSLGSDDIDGISYLYPKQQPISCGSVDIDTKNQKPWNGLLLGLSLVLLIASVYERYLKLRPRF